MSLNLKPLAEVIAQEAKELEATLQFQREQSAKRIKAIENNRRAFAMLDASGFVLDGLYPWNSGAYYNLKLGFFPHTRAGNKALAETVRKVRVALDCRLENKGQAATGDGKRVVIRLEPMDFPGITVSFERNLPKGAKCRIVRKRSTYSTLVCEA